MRISDWSSDVCSSDLSSRLIPSSCSAQSTRCCPPANPEGVTPAWSHEQHSLVRGLERDRIEDRDQFARTRIAMAGLELHRRQAVDMGDQVRRDRLLLAAQYPAVEARPLAERSGKTAAPPSTHPLQ